MHSTPMSDDDTAAGTHPHVCVVTPFYNTRAFLDECICSVRTQSYPHFEYLLCDNGSDDGSSEIAQHHAAQDPRIRYLRFEEHLPQLDNYNRAISCMSPGAAYCKLVQADDWLFPRCLEQMVGLAQAHPEVGLVGCFQLRGTYVAGAIPDPRVQVYEGRTVLREKLLRGSFGLGSQTGVMYRADHVRARATFYPPGRYHADTDVAYEILDASAFGFVPQVLCYQRVGNPSIGTTRAAFDPDELDRLIQVESYADKFLSPQDARRLRRETRRRYFRFLGQSAVRFPGSAFWRYHMQGLATIGWQPPKARIVVATLAAALELLLNPLDTMGRVASRARRRR